MLSLKNLCKTYAGGHQALQDVSLDISRGLYGLLGPNGAGKSTLMRTIATLQRPDEGSIHFNGIDVLNDPQTLRRTLGYLPQDFGAYPRTSALLMLRHLAALKGHFGTDQRRIVDNLLQMTNLWEVRHQSVDKYSGGMRQRYGIAQALIGNPALVIVDEPTAGLDPAERRRFQNILADVGKETVVLLSTHIVDDVRELCPRVAIMGAGRILRTGEPRKMMAELSGKLWTLRINREQLSTLRREHVVVSTRIKEGALEVRILSEAPPDGMISAEPELEDVYFTTLIAHDLTQNLET